MTPPRALRVLVRVDAGPSMGWGHGYRCFALTEELVRRGHRVVVLARELPPALQQLFRGLGVPMRWVRSTTLNKDAADTAQAGQRMRAHWVVVDGYKFDHIYIDRLHWSCTGSVLLMDDTAGALRYPAEIVLNHNPGAKSAWYKNKSLEGRLLAGEDYLLMRRELRIFPPRSRAFRGHVLVTLGGTDPGNMGRNILTALDQCRKVREVTVLSRNPKILKGLGAGTVRFYREADPDRICHWMDWADMAIAGAGTTAWELTTRGVPALLVELAKNQKSVVRTLVQHGAAICLNSFERSHISRMVDGWMGRPGRLARMGLNGKTVSDGCGPERVVRAMEETTLVLRPIVAGDVRRVWRWANNPEARRVSFQQEPIPWESHLAWFQTRLKSPLIPLWVGETWRGRPVGQVRFDTQRPGVARISVFVDSKERHRGWGGMLVRRGTRLFLMERADFRLVEAMIKKDNRPSVKTFERAGYSPAPALSNVGPGVLCYRFFRPRGEAR